MSALKPDEISNPAGMQRSSDHQTAEAVNLSKTSTILYSSSRDINPTEERVSPIALMAHSTARNATTHRRRPHRRARFTRGFGNSSGSLSTALFVAAALSGRPRRLSSWALNVSTLQPASDAVRWKAISHGRTLTERLEQRVHSVGCSQYKRLNNAEDVDG